MHHIVSECVQKRNSSSVRSLVHNRFFKKKKLFIGDQVFVETIFSTHQ